MEKPKCKLCGERHRLGPCRPFAKIKAGLEDALAFAKGDTSKARVTVVEALIAPVGECPYCDARRTRNAEAVRLHRARKITP